MALKERDLLWRTKEEAAFWRCSGVMALRAGVVLGRFVNAECVACGPDSPTCTPLANGAADAVT
jgi:hypothetical protein